MRHSAVSALSALLIVLFAPGLAAQGGPARATLTPLVEHERVPPSSELRAALRVSLPEGYHMNSNQPRDPLLIPVVLNVPAPSGALPSGVTVSEIVFPPAADLLQRGADQPLSVFEREFTIGIVISIGPDAAPGSVTIPAQLRYQACDETMCYIPTRADTSWSFTIGGPRSEAAHAEVFGAIRFGTGAPPPAAVPSGAPRELASDANAPLSSPTGLGVPRAGGSGAAVSGPTGSADGTAELSALERFTERGTTFGYLGKDDFLTFIHNAEQGIRERGLLEGRGPLAMLLIVLVGGLALNLTPCVLPMVPINLAIIGAGAQAGSRRRGFLLGLAYGAAMALVYGVLGLVVILTASTFGTINASPWFNLTIAILFVVLALAMFDVVNIDFSRFSSGVRTGRSASGSLVVAFAMGGVAALLAGACVAPVVIQVIVFASNLYASGTPAALALPFVLGIGMAIPWPLAGAGLAALPRPGAWMNTVKQAFGAVILVTAVYYGYEAYGLFANRWVDPAEVSSSVQAKLESGWQPSLADGLAIAEREHKPVLIDMWATWCKNCLVMDQTTLANAEVEAALAGYVKIKFQAEDPDDPRVAAVMRHFQTSGLPTYVILEPKTVD
ncbi:MAG: cytochrome c biogenesis protein CcdA [Vicinamibacterales bacterium]